MISGADLVRAGKKLGLSTSQIALVIGVHPATAYRWRSCGTLNAELRSVALLELLVRNATRELGEALSSAITERGLLVAEYILLEREFGGVAVGAKPSRRVP